jgi:heme-degrading monooxygenase HmoA
MYGRLVEIEGVDPSKREEVLQTIRETVIPGLKEIDGFAGFISLVDEDNRRARSVVLWETRESADEAESRFKARREEMVRGMGGTVRSADLYEAAIVEVTAGVHA